MNNLTAVSALLSSFQQSIATIHHDVIDLKEKYRVMQKELDEVECTEREETPFELSKEDLEKIEKIIEDKIEKMVEKNVNEMLDKLLVNILPPKILEPPTQPTEDDINLDVIQLSAKKEELPKMVRPKKAPKKLQGVAS